MFVEIDFDTAIFIDVDSVIRIYFFMQMSLNSLMVGFFDKDMKEMGVMKTLGFFMFSPLIILINYFCSKTKKEN